MKKHVEERIDQLVKKVTDYREMITSINDDIENGKLVPSDSQKVSISYIATQGREALAEIERLENLLNILPNED